jgi:hypothetical protein
MGNVVHSLFYIDEYTGQTHEYEILFNIGSILKVESVNYDSDLSVWKIEMRTINQRSNSYSTKKVSKL